MPEPKPGVPPADPAQLWRLRPGHHGRRRRIGRGIRQEHEGGVRESALHQEVPRDGGHILAAGE